MKHILFSAILFASIFSTAVGQQWETDASTSPNNIYVTSPNKIGIGSIPLPDGPTTGGGSYTFQHKTPFLQISGPSGKTGDYDGNFLPVVKISSPSYPNNSIGLGVHRVYWPTVYDYSYINTDGELDIFSTVFKVNSGTSWFTSKVTIGGAYPTFNAPGNYRLYVLGGILTEKIKVSVYNSASWADFVFDKSYKLRSLQEVDKYIAQNKHLPDVPSADEMVNNGLDVVQMDALLLQKVEELTLYMINMQKQVDELKNENQKLKVELAAVK